MSDALSNEDLVAAIRARLSALSGVTVAKELGQAVPVARRHLEVEILGVSEEITDDSTDPDIGYVLCDRTIRLRAWFVLRSDRTEAQAFAFFRSVREALVGGHDWAATYRMRPTGGTAIARQGGAYFAEPEFVSGRGLPIGGTS